MSSVIQFRPGILRTPIAYYGGKQSILHHILPLVPDHEVYTETYFGGGSLFFAKDPVSNETINDISDTVINFYVVMQSKYRKLKPLIDQSLASRSMHNLAKKMMKAPEYYSDVDLAWAFWFCTNFSFMNKIGAGLKFGMRDEAKILKNKKERFTEMLVSRIESVQIENGDAVHILKGRNWKTAFHYLDPPYFNSDQGHYSGFTVEDYHRLLDHLPNIKGKFLLSSYPSKELTAVINANPGWYQKTVNVKNQASRRKEARKSEVLVMNYAPDSIAKRDLFSKHPL